MGRRVRTASLQVGPEENGPEAGDVPRGRSNCLDGHRVSRVRGCKKNKAVSKRMYLEPNFAAMCNGRATNNGLLAVESEIAENAVCASAQFPGNGLVVDPARNAYVPVLR